MSLRRMFRKRASGRDVAPCAQLEMDKGCDCMGIPADQIGSAQEWSDLGTVFGDATLGIMKLRYREVRALKPPLDTITPSIPPD